MKSIAIFFICLTIVVPTLCLKKFSKSKSNTGFPAPNQAVRLYNAYKANWVLAPQSTASNAFTQCQTPTGSSWELFYLIPVPGSYNNAYNIKSAASNLYLEISGGSAENSAALAFTNSFNQLPQQQFSIFDPCGNGNYVIMNVKSVLAVAADCGKPTNAGCAVDQYTYSNSGIHMRWTFA